MPINTLPIEGFLYKARIAVKSNQRSLSMTIDETKQLYDSLAEVMTRLSGLLDMQAETVQAAPDITIKMDGGLF